MAKIETAFDDPDFVAHYAEGPPRFVPGFYDLHKMSGVLLSERCGNSATVLALGAGGGLELKSFSEDFPDWTVRRQNLLEL